MNGSGFDASWLDSSWACKLRDPLQQRGQINSERFVFSTSAVISTIRPDSACFGHFDLASFLVGITNPSSAKARANMPDCTKSRPGRSFRTVSYTVCTNFANVYTIGAQHCLTYHERRRVEVTSSSHLVFRRIELEPSISRPRDRRGSSKERLGLVQFVMRL